MHSCVCSSCFTRNILPLLNNWTSSVPPISPLEEGGRASREGASLCRGIWTGGGRACLLAMRVSRSVRLRVCEAVIRFQDFPSVTGLLTKPYTPLREENHQPPPDAPPRPLASSPLPPGLLHLSRQKPQSPATTPQTEKS